MNYTNLKNMLIIISLISLCLASSGLHANTSSLCKKAADKSNYDSAFLENFITLKEGNDAWLFRDNDLKMKFGPSKEGYKRLRYLNKLLNKRGVTLLMVPIQTRGIAHPEFLGDIKYNTQSARTSYISYLNRLRNLGIIVPKLESLFEITHASSLFFSRDHHWTSYGANQTAKITAISIKTLSFYEDLEKQEFQTVKNGVLDVEGSHNKAAAMLCGKAYNNEIIDTFTTINNEEMDMFADIPEAEIVLVGTSNSKGKLDFNFDGYLKEYSSVDILNLAESGGGYDGAMINYLKSDDFKSRPAKLLIWEVPSYYSLNSKTFYKKMVRLLK